MEPEFLLFVLPLKADEEYAPENLKIELINLQCDTNLAKRKFPVLRSFGLRTIAMLGSTYACEHFFPL
jgi:hypothetical protein